MAGSGPGSSEVTSRRPSAKTQQSQQPHLRHTARGALGGTAHSLRWCPCSPRPWCSLSSLPSGLPTSSSTGSAAVSTCRPPAPSTGSAGPCGCSSAAPSAPRPRMRQVRPSVPLSWRVLRPDPPRSVTPMRVCRPGRRARVRPGRSSRLVRRLRAAGLLLTLAMLPVTIGLAQIGMVPWWSLALAVGVVGLCLVALRLVAVREQTARHTERSMRASGSRGARVGSRSAVCGRGDRRGGRPGPRRTRSIAGPPSGATGIPTR